MSWKTYRLSSYLYTTLFQSASSCRYYGHCVHALFFLRRQPLPSKYGLQALTPYWNVSSLRKSVQSLYIVRQLATMWMVLRTRPLALGLCINSGCLTLLMVMLILYLLYYRNMVSPGPLMFVRSFSSRNSHCPVLTFLYYSLLLICNIYYYWKRFSCYNPRRSVIHRWRHPVVYHYVKTCGPFQLTWRTDFMLTCSC